MIASVSSVWLLARADCYPRRGYPLDRHTDSSTDLAYIGEVKPKLRERQRAGAGRRNRAKAPMFATVLHNLKGPRNVGQIIRSHVAYGGGPLLFVGYDEPWTFKKSTTRYSRKLEDQCDILHMATDDAFFAWCAENDYTPVAIEITEPPIFLADFEFPDRPALIVGHEGRGLSNDFLARCSHTVTIPQHGPVSCLNVAVACSTAMYEMRRTDFDTPAIDSGKFEGE